MIGGGERGSDDLADFFGLDFRGWRFVADLAFSIFSSCLSFGRAASFCQREDCVSVTPMSAKFWGIIQDRFPFATGLDWNSSSILLHLRQQLAGLDLRAHPDLGRLIDKGNATQRQRGSSRKRRAHVADQMIEQVSRPSLDSQDRTPGLSPSPAYLVAPSVPLAPLRAARSRKAGSFNGTFRTLRHVQRESGMSVKPDSLLPEQIPDHRERRDAHDDAAADPVSLQNLIFERDTFGVVFLEPPFTARK
jgi:hypothetical protein